MRVLITRPETEAAALQARLAQHGIAADCAPMLDIRIRRDAALPLDGVAGLLFTSVNGVRAFVANSARRDLAVWAVGEASARAARAAGFADPHVAGGDVDALAALVAAQARPQDGALLHVAGSARAGDLQGLLQTAGFDVRRVVLYDSIAAGVLPDAVAAAFAAGQYDAVLFFSPRTAATFASLSLAAGCAGGAVSTLAACLSANVASAVAALPWRATQVAAEPREAALLALLGVATAERS
jgi:uroporphyrinogen-III synthase